MGYALHLGDKSIALAADIDLELLKIRIAEAAGNGGGWVDAPAQRGRTMQVLITDNLPVYISEREYTGKIASA